MQGPMNTTRTPAPYLLRIARAAAIIGETVWASEPRSRGMYFWTYETMAGHGVLTTAFPLWIAVRASRANSRLTSSAPKATSQTWAKPRWRRAVTILPGLVWENATGNEGAMRAKTAPTYAADSAPTYPADSAPTYPADLSPPSFSNRATSIVASSMRLAF